MKKLLLVLSLIVLVFSGGIISAQDDALTTRLEAYATNLPEGYGMIRIPEFQLLLIENPDVVLFDVREISEYEAGHIEGSFNVPIRTITQNLNLLPDLDATIVVICKAGARATLATAALQILGYTDVKILVGGFDAWAAEELPVTIDPFMPEAGTAPEFEPVVFAAVDAYLSGLPQGFGLISSADLSVALIENPPLLLDVRSPDEFATGYIEGTQHIWIEELWANLDQLPEDKNTFIVIYCASGYRSAISAVIFNLLGYTNVRSLAGGLKSWVAANNPIVVPEPTFDVATALSDYVGGLPETFNALRIADLRADMDANVEMVLLDVRTVDEFVEGFIPGAINIPLNEVTANLDLLPDLDANIVVYCGSGHRSALVMMALNLLGYTNVTSLLTGYVAWSAAENPTTTDEMTVVEPATAPTFDEDVFAVVDAFITGIPQGFWVVRPTDLNVELVENPDIVLVDVRTDSEYAAGYIAGAIHIPLADFMTRVGEIPTDMPIVLYDNPTHRSSMALVALKMLGYEDVRVLAGGTGGWERAGFPLEN